MLKGGTVSFGEIPNPLVDWEEQLYGFRFVNLTPWNYLSLSSTQVGVSMQGPVKFGEKMYFDYAIGALRQLELSRLRADRHQAVHGAGSLPTRSARTGATTDWV